MLTQKVSTKQSHYSLETYIVFKTTTVCLVISLKFNLQPLFADSSGASGKKTAKSPQKGRKCAGKYTDIEIMKWFPLAIDRYNYVW